MNMEEEKEKEKGKDRLESKGAWFQSYGVSQAVIIRCLSIQCLLACQGEH